MTRRYVISGRVQGVGFRYFVRSQAKKMNIGGWVRNMPDGGVEAVATAEREVLVLFESALRSGPSLASVEKVDTAEEPVGEFGSFEVRP
jgi:acylphosphatase